MAIDKCCHKVKRPRCAGILLHPTSLPGPLSNGDIGHEAYRFIEFLHASGFKVWQMLPLGATHDDKSPYQCLSSHAGNPLLISLDWLVDKGWLDKNKESINENDEGFRLSCLQQAAANFYKINDESWIKKQQSFIQSHTHWLHDYALFIALKKRQHNTPWYDWPDALRHRDKRALDVARGELDTEIKTTLFEQFIFFAQWSEVREYAKKHGIELFGDLPIFVAKDSADVWAERDNFLMNAEGEMEFIAGVPPDAFSETGQRWGNPLYDWPYMQSTKFNWWKQRIATQLQLFDIIRIDHFRGLQACWHIPQQDETAINGSWVEVPGREMLTELFKQFHHLPLVAEDLGVITDDVIELKESFNLPGMKVLQFAFDGNNTNPHLPHHHQQNDLVYTGTHDNDTSLGWVCDQNQYNQQYFSEYAGVNLQSNEHSVWALIRMAMASVSYLCILPMQDLLMLDTRSRMNIPGTTDDNWQWRFDWQQINPDAMQQLSYLMKTYQR